MKGLPRFGLQNKQPEVLVPVDIPLGFRCLLHFLEKQSGILDNFIALAEVAERLKQTSDRWAAAEAGRTDYLPAAVSSNPLRAVLRRLIPEKEINEPAVFFFFP